MVVTLFRRILSTRYIFLLSGLTFILWSLAISLVPESSTLSSLFRMDLDQSQSIATRTQHSNYVVDAGVIDAPVSGDPTGMTRPHLGTSLVNPHIFVISLADRQDRREQMEYLRAIQNLTWTVVEAVPGNTTLVNQILDWVVTHRERNKVGSSDFRWPEEINALSVSREPLKQAGSDAWARARPPGQSKSAKSGPSTIPCAIEDDTIPTFVNDTPTWMVLSPARVACWHSHILVIRRFVEGQDSLDQHRGDEVALILEDDIDMERDISTRMSQVWTSLPAGWDIIFLGHCWSDESHYPSLTVFTHINIHPSHYPKCTHAYALSLSGARRLLQHLRYPPFAYSRALDQAYAWLIRSGRLRSYSVVPSLVVQRKSGSSDISPGSGSEWREILQNGFFEALT